MRYRLCFVHKISQVCKCGRPKYDHSRMPRADEKHRYPHKGQRVYGEGPLVRFHDGVQTCAGYEIATEVIHLDPSQVASTAQNLCMSKCDVRSEAGGKIVCFPRSGIWHSLIFTPEVV